jgi:exonuclease SbcD
LKILHTADWHLGRSLGAFELLEMQQQPALAAIIAIARDERPDAIVVAGDLYDRSVPSADAMGLFEDTVMTLREIAPVIAIAGNHDGADRVAHFSRLLSGAGVHLSATDFGAVPHVELRDAHGPVRFHLMPFAMPVEVRQAFGSLGADADDLPAATHDAVTQRRLETVDLCVGVRHVLVGHLFTDAGGTAEESDSERDISVGGSSVVRNSLFARFHYVALGHLHKPHDVVPGRVRYAGSIGRFSFSEESHEKSVSIVELDAKGGTAVRTVPIPQAQGMRTIRGTFQEVLESAPNDPRRADDFVRIQLVDVTPQFEAYRRLREHYVHLVELSYDRTATGPAESPALDRPERRDPFEMVRQYCIDRLGDRHLSEGAESLARQLLEQARHNATEGGAP